jgi:Tol biopolymer transport system component
MRMRARLITISILSCAVAASAALAKAPAPSTSTTAPGKNGAIAFKRYLDSSRTTGAIFTMDANGKNVRQITSPETGTVDDQPDWSPDGSLLVFYRCTPNACAVYTVKPDGSALTPLLPCSTGSECEDGEGGSFLPDGKRVVFTRATGAVKHLAGGDWIEHSDIVVRDVSGGTSEQALVRSPRFAGDYLSPHFSPDGSQLVYIRSNSSLVKPAHTHALFVARADGSHQRRVTPWSLDGGDDPDWSPDGKAILFRTYEAGAQQSQIATIRADGSHVRTLTHFSLGTTVLSHSFSPDGKWIVFAKSGRGGEPDLFVMRPDGSGQRPITRTALWDSAPDWGPVS